MAHALPFSLIRWLVVVAAMLVIGCTKDPLRPPTSRPSLRVEPLELVLSDRVESGEIALINTGEAPLPLRDIRIEGKDWQAFVITDSENPDVIPAASRASVHIKVDADAFQTHDEHGRTIDVRDGGAALTFEAAGQAVTVPVEFHMPSIWTTWVVPALAKILLLVLLFIMPLASLLTWAERRESAMMQDRVGPNMASIKLFGARIRAWGLLHIAADALKMLFKEDFLPKRANHVLYSIAPLLAFMPALVVFAIVPFGDGLCYEHVFDVVSQADVDQCVDGRGGTALQIAHIDIGLLFYFAIASLAIYGATLAGWSSYNKWALLGGLRASAQMISYEIAIGMTIVGALLVYGTLEPHELVRAQIDTYWGIWLQPLALILFFTAAMAETKRAPFDLPEGESEIIGYFVEYSGMRFGLFFLGEFIEVIFAGALVVTLFLGGWALPFDILGASGFSSPLACQAFFFGAGAILSTLGIASWRANRHAEGFGALVTFFGLLHVFVAIYSMFTGWGTEIPHLVIVLIGMVTWGVKVAFMCWLQLLIRWTLPRFRYDQLMSLGWKGLLPLSLANIVLTALVIYFLLSGAEVPSP